MTTKMLLILFGVLIFLIFVLPLLVTVLKGVLYVGVGIALLAVVALLVLNKVRN